MNVVQISLTADLADVVREKVRSGEYESESDVLAEGLRTLIERDATIEKWLVDEVVPVYDEMLSHPEKAMSAGETQQKLDKHMSLRRGL